MRIDIDKYTWRTWGLWIIWTVFFCAAEYVSFYMPYEGELAYWQIATLETIWLFLGVTMMLITIYQYKYHPSKAVKYLKSKMKKKHK